MINKIKLLNQSAFSSLKIRNYRLYFIGQAVSQSGTWMQIIGQSWLVLQLTNSGAQLGLVAAAQFLPVLIAGPWAGVLVDRYDKRKIIFITQILFSLLALILAMLISFHLVQLWMIYILAAGLGLLTAIDTPARQTFTFEMVGEKQLQNAVSLNSMLFNTSRIVGPALAGTLIAATGLAACFYLNAASFLAIIIGLIMMNPEELFKGKIISRSKGQLLAGLKYVKSQPELRDILIIMAIVGTFVFEFSVSIPLLAQKTFLGDARVYAALTSSMGIGSVIGGFLAATSKKPNFKKVNNSIWMFCGAMILSAIAPNLYLEMIALALVGFCATTYSSSGNTALQLKSDPQMRGRVLALWNTGFLGSTPIGGPIIGWVGESFGPRWSMMTGALAACLAAMYGSSRLRSYDKKIKPS